MMVLCFLLSVSLVQFKAYTLHLHSDGERENDKTASIAEVELNEKVERNKFKKKATNNQAGWLAGWQ